MECKYPTVNKKGECAICWDAFRLEMSHQYKPTDSITNHFVAPHVNYRVVTVFMTVASDYGLSRMQHVPLVAAN